MRTLVLAGVSLWLLACPTKTPPPCDATNCMGCCDESGACQPGDTQLACGVAGNGCRVCGNTAHCGCGQCIISGLQCADSGFGGGGFGTGGGSAVGGGSATGGGSSTGGGAATGGGSATGGGTGNFGAFGNLVDRQFAFPQYIADDVALDVDHNTVVAMTGTELDSGVLLVKVYDDGGYSAEVVVDHGPFYSHGFAIDSQGVRHLVYAPVISGPPAMYGRTGADGGWSFFPVADTAQLSLAPDGTAWVVTRETVTASDGGSTYRYQPLICAAGSCSDAGPSFDDDHGSGYFSTGNSTLGLGVVLVDQPAQGTYATFFDGGAWSAPQWVADGGGLVWGVDLHGDEPTVLWGPFTGGLELRAPKPAASGTFYFSASDPVGGLWHGPAGSGDHWFITDTLTGGNGRDLELQRAGGVITQAQKIAHDPSFLLQWSFVRLDPSGSPRVVMNDEVVDDAGVSEWAGFRYFTFQ